MWTQEEITTFLTAYAYDPPIVFGFVILMMTASSFGLPIPEEVTLIAAGVVAHISLHPEIYPPPAPGMVPVNAHVLAAVCFFAVFLTDLLVFFMGRAAPVWFGGNVYLKKFMGSRAYQAATKFLRERGQLAPGLFRFTPGIRFPGHFACGAAGIPIHKFVLVDGIAALLSVPTQVLLVAYYGQQILSVFKNVKLVMVGLLVLGLAYGAYRYFRQKEESV
jgi:membrane protein DedA with SNARE-associated domain